MTLLEQYLICKVLFETGTTYPFMVLFGTGLKFYNGDVDNTMEIIKMVGVALIGLIIIILLKQYKPEFAIYISLLIGVLILLLVIDELKGIISLLQSLTNKVSINSTFITLLIKITGIAFLSEFAVSVCKDSGESAIASKIEIGSKIIIISMSIPIISSLLEIILKILPT